MSFPVNLGADAMIRGKAVSKPLIVPANIKTLITSVAVMQLISPTDKSVAITAHNYLVFYLGEDHPVIQDGFKGSVTRIEFMDLNENGEVRLLVFVYEGGGRKTLYVYQIEEKALKLLTGADLKSNVNFIEIKDGNIVIKNEYYRSNIIEKQSAIYKIENKSIKLDQISKETRTILERSPEETNKDLREAEYEILNALSAESAFTENIKKKRLVFYSYGNCRSGYYIAGLSPAEIRRLIDEQGIPVENVFEDDHGPLFAPDNYREKHIDFIREYNRWMVKYLDSNPVGGKEK